MKIDLWHKGYTKMNFELDGVFVINNVLNLDNLS